MCNRAGSNEEMAFLDRESNSELDILHIAEVDKVFQQVVRWLRNKNTTQYLENHPAARDTLVTAVQEVTRPKLPSTPAPTPSNPDTQSWQADTPISAQYAEDESPDTCPHIAQDRNNSLDHSSDLRQTPSRETDYQNPPATQRELEDGSHPYTPIGHAEVPEGERVMGDHQHSNLVILPQAEQGDASCHDASSFVQPFSKGAHRPRKKRKRDSDVCAPESISSPSSVPSSADMKGGRDRFMELSESLRAKVHMIGNTATLQTIEECIKYIGTPPAFVDACADAPEEDASLEKILASDQRLRVLKHRIVRDEAAEKAAKYLKIAVKISKRAALAELIGWYIKERVARPALKDYLTDLLFPETKRTEQQGEETEQEVEEREQKGEVKLLTRRLAKRKLTHWITLGEPIAKMVQQFGHRVLLRLPAKLTDKDLCELPRPQIQLFLDYIDSIHPGLKEKASNLSDLLPYRIDANPVLDNLMSNVLSDFTSRQRQGLSQVANGSDMAGPSINQTPIHSHLPHPHGQPQSPRKSGKSSDPITEKAPSVYQKEAIYLQELEQHSDGHQSNPSLSQTDHRSIEQPSQTGESPDFGDYYPEEHDWRANPQPSDDEEIVADLSWGDLDRLSSTEEFIDWDTFTVQSP